MSVNKERVYDFWQKVACGEGLYLRGSQQVDYQTQAEVRYRLEPYINDFAEFGRYSGKRVLEIGVGLGADHQKFAEAGAVLSGIDLTPRAVEHAQERLRLFGLPSDVRVMDAENLAFSDDSFDMVYSWGVLHHSPDTSQAISEVYRVLKPGGEAKIMIYHTYSMVGYMLWLRYGLIRLNPFLSWPDVYGRYLESPGTKAYSIPEARELFRGFQDVSIKIVQTHGDLLTSDAGQRHRGILLSIARRIWPRGLIRRFLPNAGLFMLVHGRK